MKAVLEQIATTADEGPNNDALAEALAAILKKAVSRKSCADAVTGRYRDAIDLDVVHAHLGARTQAVRLLVVGVLASLGRPESIEPLRAALDMARKPKVVDAIQAALQACGDTSLEISVPDTPDAASDADLDATLCRYQLPDRGLPDGLSLRWRSGADLSAGAVRWVLNTVDSFDPRLEADGLWAVRSRLDEGDLRALPGTGEGRGVTDPTTHLAELIPLLDPWMFEGKAARSVKGLRLVEAIASELPSDHPAVELALQGLDQYAHTAKSKSLRAKARDAMGRIATALGMGAEELADLAVPTFGFGPDGTRPLPWGSRTLTLRLAGTAVEYVSDQGKVLKRLPQPRKDDDAVAMRQARAVLTKERKYLKKALVLQHQRLETALVTGREWTLRAWERLFVHHPLLRGPGRALVWETDGTRFVIEDDALVGDGPVSLGETVRLAHPVELTEAELDAWRRRVTAKQPVDQLYLRAWTLADPATELSERIADGETLAPRVFRSRLKARGYTLGEAEDAGLIYRSYKILGEWTVMVDHEGVDVMASYDDPVRVEAVSATHQGQRMAWGEVPARLQSEVRDDLEVLVS